MSDDRLEAAASLASLGTISAFLSSVMARSGVPSNIAHDILLAVEEVCVNIVQHGYRGEEGGIELRVRGRERALTVEVRDHAPAFDPLAVPPPDLSEGWEGREVGGLGVHFVRNLAEEVSYRREQGQNILLLSFGW